MLASPTPRIDAFLETRAPAYGRHLSLAIQKLESKTMNDRPNLPPNDAALELLRESLTEQRAIRGDVTGIKEDLGEIRGMDLKGRFEKVDKVHAQLAEDIRKVSADVSAVKTEIVVIKTASEPGKFFVKEGLKASLMAVLAAIVGWVAGHSGELPPHH